MALSKLIERLGAGDRIFMGGSAGEVRALTDAIVQGLLPPLSIASSFVPGINAPPAALPPGTTWINPFPFGQSAITHMPASYGSYAAWLDGQRFDACIVHVASPSGRRASLGAAAEFMPSVLKRSARIIAVVNPQMPRLSNAAHLDLDDAWSVDEIECDLPEYDAGVPGADARTIAAHVASFIDDDAALQVGLGKVPDALMPTLIGRKRLRLQSGMLSDGVRQLVESGSLDERWVHISCVHVGSTQHYRWLDGRADFAVLGCEVTHNPEVLARTGRLVALNGALEVDLLGQANLETAGKRTISGVGGSADFARAASLGARSISIIGLPAKGPKGRSRIVSRVGTVSLPRHDVEVVVTEFGVADLRGLGEDKRAERLIDVAAPEHRQELADAWANRSR